jgi:hypothetical protein
MMPDNVTLNMVNGSRLVFVDHGESELISSFTEIWYSDGSFESYRNGQRQYPRKIAMTIKEHNDEREFWETILLNKFITWKECLKGMRACRKRERGLL